MCKIRTKRKTEATFADFVDFVDEWSQALSDPVYARGGFRDNKSDRVKACATEVEEKGKGGGKKDEDKSIKGKCPLCTTQHDLDDCPTFKEKTARDKKDFLFKTKMCSPLFF